MIAIMGKVAKLLLLDEDGRDDADGKPFAVVNFDAREHGITNSRLVLLKGEFELGDHVEITLRRHRKANGEVLPR